MFSLPISTELHKPIHKKVIFNKFPTEFTGERKKRFDDDVGKITITNEISPVSINISEGKEIQAIYVVQVDLKKSEYDERNIIYITKLFGQHLLVALKYQEMYRLAIYQTRLLQSEWKSKDDINLNLVGLTLDAVWENLVSKVSGIVVSQKYTLDQQIQIEEEKVRLKEQISKLEKRIKTETQSKKKFDLYQRLKEYQKKLEEL